MVTIRIMKSKKEKHYDWNVQADAFLAAAYNLCQIAVDDKTNYLNTLHGTGLFSMFPAGSMHPNYEMGRVIVFCIKHAIELFLKSFGIINISELIKKHNIKEIKDNFRDRFNDNTKELLKTLIDDIWEIVEKYFYGKYIDGNKRSFDEMNLAERYPENDCYEVPDNFSWATIDKFNCMKVDILFLQKRFDLAVKEIWDVRMLPQNY